MQQILENWKQSTNESVTYHRTKMQKDIIFHRLREKGCRITKQRIVLLDIILEEECSCCKEIFYKALKRDNKIGTATVYRMVNILEEIGAISRQNMYKISCGKECENDKVCFIYLDDDTVIELSSVKWSLVIERGLMECGYLADQAIVSVMANSCACNRTEKF